MMNCIVLIGSPCSGKSTIGKKLAEEVGYKYVSSGDIARQMAKEDGTAENLTAGNMAPEDKMRAEITKVFNGYDNIVLDGFPRFTEQWDWMMMNFKHKYEFAFIVIDVPVITLINRMISRNRADDVSFMDRVKYYANNTVPMINEIDGYCALYGVGVPSLFVINDTVDASVSQIRRYLNDRSWF